MSYANKDDLLALLCLPTPVLPSQARREWLITEELERKAVWGRAHPVLTSCGDLAELITLRTWRAIQGAVLGGLTVWPAVKVVDLASQPIASLSLLDVVAILFLGGLVLMLAASAFALVFGSGPSVEERAAAARGRAERLVDRRLALEARRAKLLSELEPGRRPVRTAGPR